MKNLNVGYVVVIEEGGVGELKMKPLVKKDKAWPQAGLLLSGLYATLFPSNLLAKQAIYRTVQYAKATQHKDWPELTSYRIVLVISIVQ